MHTQSRKLASVILDRQRGFRHKGFRSSRVHTAYTWRQRTELFVLMKHNFLCVQTITVRRYSFILTFKMDCGVKSDLKAKVENIGVDLFASFINSRKIREAPRWGIDKATVLLTDEFSW